MKDAIDSLTGPLDALPRLGWVDGPSPITPLPELADALGLAWLGAKRDDLLGALHGGTKVRKLDHLLATPPFDAAPRWAAAGAIGSGLMVAMTAAAERLDRYLDAYLFWEPTSARVEENLARIASGAAALRFRPGRVGLFLRHPSVIAGRRIHGAVVVPPGATAPPAIAGLVRAAWELAAQIRDGHLPPPDRVYAPLGSGGAVAGLAIGLAAAGLTAQVHAIATVERLFASRGRLEALVRQTRRWLAEAGVHTPEPSPIVIDRSALGRGYGHPTPEGAAAIARAGALPLEAVYSAKAMAALIARPPRGERVLFWVTPRRPDPLPVAADWRSRLPRALIRRLADPDAHHRLTRRKAALVALGGAAAVSVYVRLGGYPPLSGWRGEVLNAREAHIVRAAAEALLPPAPDEGAFDEVPVYIDRFLVAQPPRVHREVHALLLTVEHATTPLGLRWSRMSALPAAAREAYLQRVRGLGPMPQLIYRSLRDLVMLGYYPQARAWRNTGYEGPWQTTRLDADAYDDLRAGPGDRPKAQSKAVPA